MADPRTEESRENRRTSGPNDPTPDLAGVRDDDMEPHAGLRYVARLFKVLALLILLLLIAEVVLQIWRAGLNAVPTLLVNATQMIVLGALLWGAGDLALMLIESNHDLRATRILVGRLNGKVARLEATYLPRSGGSGQQQARRSANYVAGPGDPPEERPPSHREGLG